MLPKTWVGVAPKGIEGLGRTIPFKEIATFLMVKDPRVQIPTPEHFWQWYPGQSEGITCIWIGTPSAIGSIKVSAITMGPVPEWTQLNEAQEITHLGWRAIFAKCLRSQVRVSKYEIEKYFKVDLTQDGRDGLCQKCRMLGYRNPTNGGTHCDMHAVVEWERTRQLTASDEANYIRRKEGLPCL